NRMSVEALRRHPYLNFYQSRTIVEHRRKYGPIKELQSLSLYDEFTSKDIERLQPYVCFDE
ncbi:MAG: helix-hairpin-helix domain-containing protein, partial [Paraprevotella sp.]|nr:helix-hairpin-helix domain-containing protein [Paraprevotella sp.]